MRSEASDKTPLDGDELITIADVQRKLKLSRTTLRKLERDGVLLPVRVSRRCIRYRPRAVHGYIAHLEAEREDYRGPGRPRGTM